MAAGLPDQVFDFCDDCEGSANGESKRNHCADRNDYEHPDRRLVFAVDSLSDSEIDQSQHDSRTADDGRGLSEYDRGCRSRSVGE